MEVPPLPDHQVAKQVELAKAVQEQRTAERKKALPESFLGESDMRSWLQGTNLNRAKLEKLRLKAQEEVIMI